MAATHESRNFFLDGPAGRLEAILWRPANSKRPPLAALVTRDSMIGVAIIDTPKH